MAIKVMTVATGVVAVAEIVGLGEVVAEITVEKNPVVRRLTTVTTSRTSTCPRQCKRINLRPRKQSFMSCAWYAWRRKELRAKGRSISVKLSPCSVSLMKSEWGMMTHPMMRPTYLIVPTLIYKEMGWTLKITRIVYVRVVPGKEIIPRNEKMRRPKKNMSEQPHMPAWLQWPPDVLFSFENQYLQLQPVSLHI